MTGTQSRSGIDWSHSTESLRDRDYIHRRTRLSVEAIVAAYREKVGLEPFWRIEVRVCCESELVEQEAEISFHLEAWYALLQVRCGLSPSLTRWVVVHELCELQRYRTGALVVQMVEIIEQIGDLCNVEIHGIATGILERYREARNQEIEQWVYALLGERRPGHIITTTS